MAGLIIALIVALGFGGTVAASNSARPGDALFGLDRAVENVRINLTKNEEKKNELRIKFTEERVKEIENLTSKSQQLERPASSELTEANVTEIEADVFINETVIKIEYSDSKKFVFTSEVKTETEVVDEINKNFPALSKTFILSKLNLEMEDRASRDNDKKIVGLVSSLSDDDKSRVSLGIEEALNLLASLKAVSDGDDARLDEVISLLNAYMDDFPSDSRVWVGDDKFRIKYESGSEKVDIKEQGDDKIKIDAKTEDGRIRIEIKNGVVEIKSKGSSDDDDNGSDSNQGLTEVEVKIFTDKTTVQVELNDEKTIFTTSETDKDKIIAEIITRFPTLTKEQIESIIEIENKDESDDDSDSSDDSDDDSDDNNSDSNDDDENDDDNSGSNSGKGND